MSPLFKLSLAAGAAVMALGVQAQGFPAKPITLIVPFAAGGPTDKVARDGSMPFCVELDNLKDTDAPIHQPAAMLVAAD